MMELIKEKIKCGGFVDKQFEKPAKSGIIRRFFNRNKFLGYIFMTFLVLTVANATLIYSFFKLLEKL